MRISQAFSLDFPASCGGLQLEVACTALVRWVEAETKQQLGVNDRTNSRMMEGIFSRIVD
jgi:hypothetical protein